MTTRTTIKTVTFKRSFVLGDPTLEHPAGDYMVETDEELLEGLSFPAYRRTLTLIHLHGRPGQPANTRPMEIDPDALDAALARDTAGNRRPPAAGRLAGAHRSPEMNGP